MVRIFPKPLCLRAAAANTGFDIPLQPVSGRVPGSIVR
jgi:hypothetical protein